MASTVLSRTLVTGNRQIFTYSAWIKRSDLGEGFLFQGYTSTSSFVHIKFDSNYKLGVFGKTGGSDQMDLVTSRVFKDVGAFYHVVVAVDTTQSTDTNRVKVYINGVQETSFSTTSYPSINTNLEINVSGHIGYIGAQYGTQAYYGGLMSYVAFVDGSQELPTAFGETNAATGIWKVNTSPSVTYGNNGFFLKMDTSSPGTDTSGKNNTYTASGTPTLAQDNASNNLATFNSIYKSLNQPTYTNGNLTVTTSGNEYRLSFSSIAASTGKWYAEFKRVVGTTDEVFLGVSSENDVNTYFPITNEYLGASSKSVGITSGNGKYYISSSATTYAASYTAGDIIGIALDLTNKKLYASKNGAWANGSGAWDSATFNSSTGAIDISSIIPSGEFGFLGCSNSGTSTFSANFGNGFFGTTAVTSSNADAAGHGLFEYAVPTGYYTLNTKNLNTYGG